MKNLKNLLSVLVNPMLVLPLTGVVSGAIFLSQNYSLRNSEIKHEQTRVVAKPFRDTAIGSGYIPTIVVKCNGEKIFGVEDCLGGNFGFEVRPSIYDGLEVGQELSISYKTAWGKEYQILDIKNIDKSS